MKIREILGSVISPEAEETLDMLLTDRFQRIGDQRSVQEKAEIAEKYKRIEELVREHYADSPEECERLLAEMIAEMKVEIAAEKKRLRAAPKAG